MHDSSQSFDEVYFALCKSAGTAYALGCWLAWKGRCFTQIHRPNPSLYDSADAFSKDYLVYCWPSKAQINLEGIDLKAKAIAGFIADEKLNAETNRRIREWNVRGGSPRVESVIHTVRRKIRSILGPLDKSRVLRGCRFGNGASATFSRRHARYDQKITTLPLSVSPRAYCLGKALVESDPHWLAALGHPAGGFVTLLPENFQVVDYNVLDTVPKSLKTDRTIAKEPTLNGFMQQSVHIYLRERLLLTGIDLRRQENNQDLASWAQKLGLATLDLESASNSVTVELVKLLLPEEWFDLLDILRSHNVRTPDGDIAKLEMFSSMGNAFTFELETLIFYSILCVICKDHSLVSVYGDDMICPQWYAADCIEILEAFGFRVNYDKSFLSGRFFESCGKHFFDGYDVTPVFQKKTPTLNRGERIRAHNRLIRWAQRSGFGLCLDPVVFAATSLLSRNEEKWFGPLGAVGDNYYLRPYGEYKVYHGNAVVHLWVATKKNFRNRQAAAYAYWLRLRGPQRREAQHTEDVPIRIPFYGYYSMVNDLPSERLVLSNRNEEDQGYRSERDKIPIMGLDVDVTWASNTH